MPGSELYARTTSVLVVFPSHVKHMAFPYSGERDRVIVSFHAQVHGETDLKYNYEFV